MYGPSAGLVVGFTVRAGLTTALRGRLGTASVSVVSVSVTTRVQTVEITHQQPRYH